MAVTEAGPARPGPAPGAPAASPRPGLADRLKRDVAVALAYTAGAGFITWHLWRHLGTRMVTMSKDEVFFMWVLRHGLRVLTHGENPFVTYRLNAPAGVNLMANTSSLALTLPMAPVTALWGPRVSFAALLVIGLAGTAFAWYHLLRRLVARPAAAVGGAFCGFAPGMISQSDGHVNWVAQFLVPLLVLALLRLTEPGHAVRRGAVLGLLATVQAFVNEEVLLSTAIGCAVFLLAYGAFSWRADAAWVRDCAARLVRGLAVAAAVAAPLLAYPLSVQFLGPQAYRGLPGDLRRTGSDLAAYWSFSGTSLAGSRWEQPLALNVTEQNSFFGWPLLLVVALGLAWLWPRVLARAIVVTGAVFFVLSLGPSLVVSGRSAGVPLPWAVVGRLPLLDSALPTRFSLALIPLVGIVLALIVQRIADLGSGAARRVGLVALGAALVPVLPLPLRTVPFPVTPAFVSSGHWKAYVPAGRSLVPVPDDAPQDMAWQADADATFAVPGGYFLGPDSRGHGTFGASPPRPSWKLFLKVAASGRAPAVTDQLRRDLRDDLAYWRASVLVMPLGARHAAQLRGLVDALTGTVGQQVDDVVVWRV